MADTATAPKKGRGRAKPEPLGQAELFLPEKYDVLKHRATLGGITLDDITQLELAGLVQGDTCDLILRNVKVTGVKTTHKGEVTKILHCDNMDVAPPVLSEVKDGDKE